MIEIKKVENKKDLERFIQLHYDLYRGCPYDAPNLHSDEVQTLSPWVKDPNAAFEFCDVEYYLALKEGKVVGRVAAIINNRYNEQWNTSSTTSTCCAHCSAPSRTSAAATR